LEAMVGETVDPLAAAQLTPGERGTLARFASRLQESLEGDFRALWLYGSRARRTGHPESDVDLLVIADGGRKRYGRMAGDPSEEAAVVEGESLSTTRSISMIPNGSEGAARSESFFIQEVDRDKIVLAGSALD
jgi:Polymerase beta, Nucleotidyltransferase